VRTGAFMLTGPREEAEEGTGCCASCKQYQKRSEPPNQFRVLKIMEHFEMSGRTDLDILRACFKNQEIIKYVPFWNYAFMKMYGTQMQFASSFFFGF
jgi:hypothetical protein